jgi:hypothetical protein
MVFPEVCAVEDHQGYCGIAGEPLGASAAAADKVQFEWIAWEWLTAGEARRSGGGQSNCLSRKDARAGAIQKLMRIRTILRE